MPFGVTHVSLLRLLSAILKAQAATGKGRITARSLNRSESNENNIRDLAGVHPRFAADSRSNHSGYAFHTIVEALSEPGIGTSLQIFSRGDAWRSMPMGRAALND